MPATEVLAASIYRSNLPDKIVNNIFSDVSRESVLLLPVSNWLQQQGYEPYAEVPLGTKRIDVLGRKKSLLFGDRFLGVELKNDIVQFERALDQMTTFREYTHVMYFACTPAMAAQYLDRHSEARGVHYWDSTVLRKKLESFGFGMLLVEEQNVFEVLKPAERRPQEAKVEELRRCLMDNLKVRSLQLHA